MNEEVDRKTIAASDLANEVLSRLKEDEIFAEEMDAYKFAIGLGLALNKRTPLGSRTTKFNLGSFDKDQTVASIIVSLMPEAARDPYRAAEELAETGFARISAAVAAREFRFSDVFETVSADGAGTT